MKGHNNRVFITVQTNITSSPSTSSESYTEATQHTVSSSVVTTQGVLYLIEKEKCFKIFLKLAFLFNPTQTCAPCAVDVSGNITPTVQLNINKSEVTDPPALLSGNSLTTLAFGRLNSDKLIITFSPVLKYFFTGVMSLILILIVVMVILVTTINLRGQCRSTKQQEGEFLSCPDSLNSAFQSAHD